VELLIERLIQSHRYAYYALGTSYLSDGEFDILYREGLKLAPKGSPVHQPGIDLFNVPSRIVWGVTTREGRKALYEATDKYLAELKSKRSKEQDRCDSIREFDVIFNGLENEQMTKNKTLPTDELTTVAVKNALIKKVDEFCISHFEKGPRSHMGASEIGDECWRKLWLKFRFCGYKEHTARMHRLFNRGHAEELRVKQWLEGGGIKFLSQQDNFKSCGGHFAGSSDGSILLPQLEYLDTLGNTLVVNYDKPILWECKTYKKGSDFANLFEKGVAYVNPKHFAQMSVYCRKFGFEYALYTAVCKDDDEIYYEIVKPNFDLADSLEEKAASIINAQEEPPRMSEDSTFKKCKWCDFSDVCFGKKQAFKCCRSCKNAEACEDEIWQCSIHGEIPKEYLGCETDCDSYIAIYEG
jgi:hypothetical protein